MRVEVRFDAKRELKMDRDEGQTSL